MLRSSKKGFMFTLDILLCVVIIAIGFILAWSALTAEPPKEQPYLIADSVASLMVSTKNYEVMNKMKGGVLGSLKNKYDPETSMWEQIALFHINGDGYEENYIENALGASIPKQYAMAVVFDGDVVYNGTAGILGRSPSESAFVVSSKRLIVVVTNETELEGPFIGEVRIW